MKTTRSDALEAYSAGQEILLQNPGRGPESLMTILANLHMSELSMTGKAPRLSAYHIGRGLGLPESDIRRIISNARYRAERMRLITTRGISTLRLSRTCQYVLETNELITA